MVALVRAVREDLKERQVGCKLGVLGEGLDLWLLEELCEDVGVCGGGGSRDEVGGGPGRCGRFGESEERLWWKCAC